MHTPAELYGSGKLPAVRSDKDWLPSVSGHGWMVLGRDVKIYKRPS